MNIYIASSLTHIPKDIFDEYTLNLHKIAKGLNHYEIKYALINSDPQLSELEENEKAEKCYLWDREMVENADLVIAECSFPSIGLGIELQIAESKKIPVIIIYKDFIINRTESKKYLNPNNIEYNLQIGEGFVSLMALGLPNLINIIKYSELSVLVNKLHLSIKNSI